MEQAQEIRLSDGMPDIGRILCAWGQPILRGKEWSSDAISVSAGMMVWVLYLPEEGGTARVMESWIPFQMLWDLPEGTQEGQIRVTCLPRFVDARTVSGRKMMIRAGMGALAEVFSDMSADVYQPDSLPEDVELLRRRYPVRLPREAGEKVFLLDEDLTLPAAAPQPEKLLYYRLHPCVADQRVLGNKIVFRGKGNLHILYESEEGQLHSWDFELPYSQYADLQGSYSPDAQVEIQPMVTNLELDLDEEGHFRLKAGMVGQYLVDDQQILELVEDAYSNIRDMEVKQQRLELPGILENRGENIYGEHTLSAEANLVADASFLPDFPRQRAVENGVQLDNGGVFQVLYYGADGSLQASAHRMEDRKQIPADGNVQMTAMPSGPAQVQAVPGNGTIQLKAEVPLRMTSISASGMPMVTQLETGEQKTPDPSRPSLILRRMGEESLWELAKKSGSTVEAIQQANQLQEEPRENQMLLIPVS